MRSLGVATLCFFTALTVTASDASGQAVGGAERARPVQGDPGISSMLVLEETPFRILRDYAEPGATRRWHAHSTATYQIFMLVTGAIRLTVEGRDPIDILPGEVVSLPGGASHTFTNTGEVTATIVEVFGIPRGMRVPSILLTKSSGESELRPRL